MTARCLALVFSTPNLISALAAIRTLYPGGGARVTVGVCDWPGASDALNLERLQLFGRMVAGIELVESVILLKDSAFAEARQAGSLAAFGQEIRRQVGLPTVERILFTHDCVGSIYQATCVAYPSARPVCYGDGFGIHVSKERYLLLNRFGLDPAKPLRNYLKIARYGVMRRWRRWRLRLTGLPLLAGHSAVPPLEDVYFRPSCLCLILPFLIASRTIGLPPLVNVPRAAFREVLRQVGVALGATAYEDRLLAAHAGRTRVILATENHVEAATMTFDNELQMYMAFLEPYLGQNPVVIVKPHPGETRSRSEPLRELLGGRAEVVDFDPGFARTPLEIFERLLRDCTVITAANIIFTAKYLYGVDVVQGMTTDIIERYIVPSYRDSHHNGIASYAGILARLERWDGRGILYRRHWA